MILKRIVATATFLTCLILVSFAYAQNISFRDASFILENLTHHNFVVQSFHPSNGKLVHGFITLPPGSSRIVIYQHPDNSHAVSLLTDIIISNGKAQYKLNINDPAITRTDPFDLIVSKLKNGVPVKSDDYQNYFRKNNHNAGQWQVRQATFIISKLPS